MSSLSTLDRLPLDVFIVLSGFLAPEDIISVVKVTHRCAVCTDVSWDMTDLQSLGVYLKDARDLDDCSAANVHAKRHPSRHSRP